MNQQVIQGPLTNTRVHESWWWVQQDQPHQSSICSTEKLVRRAQSIYGGRIEVIHQSTTTTTTVYELTA